MDNGEAQPVYANTSVRDPKRVIEEVVEENADEYNPHASYYEGADDTPLNTTVHHTAYTKTSIPHEQNLKYCTTVTVPGRCIRGVLDALSFIICIFLVIIQMGLIDYYYMTVRRDKIWYSWIGADALVIVVFLWLLILAVKYNQTKMEQDCFTDGKVKFAWIGWLIYSTVLVGKVATCFRLFYHELLPVPLDNNDKLFDDNLFKLGLSLSVLIFLFLLEAHHYTTPMSTRQIYISYLTTAVAFDLVDNIYFLDLLWQSFKDTWNLPFWLEITILAVSCINFIIPTFVLLKLRFNRFPRYLIVSDKIWAFLYVLIVNGPFLGLRIYLYILLELEQKGKQYDASLFAVKNIAVLYLAIRELWIRLQYWRMKKQAALSTSEITLQKVNTHKEN